MNNTSLQKKCIDKILHHPEFASSHLYKSYLTYLLEAKENNKTLKETTIAIEFFGKSADFNPAEDTTVRSHTYNLRKKLETYYLKEGKDDKYPMFLQSRQVLPRLWNFHKYMERIHHRWPYL